MTKYDFFHAADIISYTNTSNCFIYFMFMYASLTPLIKDKK